MLTGHQALEVPGKRGRGYLEVTINPCEAGSSKTCGKISSAFNSKLTTAAGLDVEGYVAFLCSGKDWTRVK